MLKNLAIVVGLMAGLSACIPYGYNGYRYNTIGYAPYGRTFYYGPGYNYRY